MESAGIFYGHLVYFMAIWCTYFMAIWCILWPFGVPILWPFGVFYGHLVMLW
jgi:hypothetical protein